MHGAEGQARGVGVGDSGPRLGVADMLCGLEQTSLSLGVSSLTELKCEKVLPVVSNSYEGLAEGWRHRAPLPTQQPPPTSLVCDMSVALGKLSVLGRNENY